MKKKMKPLKASNSKNGNYRSVIRKQSSQYRVTRDFVCEANLKAKRQTHVKLYVNQKNVSGSERVTWTEPYAVVENCGLADLIETALIHQIKYLYIFSRSYHLLATERKEN